MTSPTLRPAADTLAASKTAAGFAVGVREVAPNTAAADVRTLIRGELNSTTCTRPTYVVLLGDTSHVPSFQEFCPGIDACQVTSDLSYSLERDRNGRIRRRDARPHSRQHALGGAERRSTRS